MATRKKNLFALHIHRVLDGAYFSLEIELRSGHVVDYAQEVAEAVRRGQYVDSTVANAESVRQASDGNTIIWRQGFGGPRVKVVWQGNGPNDEKYDKEWYALRIKTEAECVEELPAMARLLNVLKPILAETSDPQKIYQQLICKANCFGPVRYIGERLGEYVPGVVTEELFDMDHKQDQRVVTAA
jgi:hypothetical protein